MSARTRAAEGLHARRPAVALVSLVPLAPLVLLFGWVAWLGVPALFDVDEGAFAQASRQMLAGGDWGHTMLDGVDRFDKPILVYWLQAASMGLFGATEFAVRLPSALCAWLWCLATWGFVAARWGRDAGLAAALVLATSAGPLLIGRAATADALLNLLLALTLFDLWRYLEAASGADATWWSALPFAHLRRAALWCGLGLLAKGPVALLVPAGAALLWALLARGRMQDVRRAWQVLGRALGHAPAWAIVAGVALPWYLYALNRHGMAFVDGFLLRHNVQRFSGTLEGHGAGIGYYLVVLPVLMLPWTPLLAGVLARLRGLLAQPRESFLLAWAAFVFAFFSLSGTKLPHYVLYGYTPLAVLAGLVLAGHWRAPGDGVSARPGRALALMLAACLACMAALVVLGTLSPRWAVLAARAQPDAHWHLLLDAASLPPAPAWPAGAAALGVVLMAAGLCRREPARAFAWLGAAALAVSWWVSAQLVPWWAQALQQPVKDLALHAQALGQPVVQWQVRQPSLGFYLGQPAPRHAPRPGQWALVRLPLSDPKAMAGSTIVAQARGYALIRRDGEENSR